MTQKDLDKGIKDLKNIGLTSTEKSEILKRVLETPVISTYSGRKSNLWFFMFAHKKFTYSIATLLIFLMTGGTTIYAAETSVPGSPLYPIKIEVIERVGDMLNKTPEDKAKWEANKAIRRLEEAEKLAANGNLTDEMRSIIEKKFDKHTDSLSSVLDEFPHDYDLETKKDLEADFEAKVSAHKNILVKVYAHVGRETDNGIDFLTDIVDEKIQNIRFRRGTEDYVNENAIKADTRGLFEDRKFKAKNAINTIEKNLEIERGKGNGLHKAILVDSESSLTEAKKSFVKAQFENENGDKREALDSMRESVRAVTESRTTLERGLKIKRNFRK